MFKAYIKWSKMLPLIQKCDELGKQLHERLLVVSSLRESYFRDVLCVKHHLEKLKEFSSKLPAISNKPDSTSDENKIGDVSENLKDRMTRAVILPEAKHSDHCPILVEID